MPTYEDAAQGAAHDAARTAAEAQQSLHGLAHASRQLDDPADAYRVVGSLAWGMAAIHQTLGQLIALYEGPARDSATVGGDPIAGRSQSVRIAEVLWEVRQAVEFAGRDLDKAHQIEATITHTTQAGPDVAAVDTSAAHHQIGVIGKGVSR